MLSMRAIGASMRTSEQGVQHGGVIGAGAGGCRECGARARSRRETSEIDVSERESTAARLGLSPCGERMSARIRACRGAIAMRHGDRPSGGRRLQKARQVILTGVRRGSVCERDD